MSHSGDGAQYGATASNDAPERSNDDHAPPPPPPPREVIVFLLRLTIFERAHFTLGSFVTLIAGAIALTPLCVYVLLTHGWAQRWFVAHVNALQAAEVYLLCAFATAFMPGMAALLSTLLRVDVTYVVVLGLVCGALDLAYNSCCNVALYLALIKPSDDGGFAPVAAAEAAQLRGRLGAGPNSFALTLLALLATYLLLFAALHLMHSAYYRAVKRAVRSAQPLQRYEDSAGNITV
eukprot:TRINITY_DN1591_c0_g1_i1.p1 TRINITY_DN1591_c0_g1~~TRINITY_DN1591_c0_g1_i1.p1  ORF type:complete len:235 (+),score=66.93 TRINITY_DN1591_c0_g1_i1:75-779(+)